MDKKFQDVGKIDKWIERLMRCEYLTEAEVQELCVKVRSLYLSAAQRGTFQGLLVSMSSSNTPTIEWVGMLRVYLSVAYASLL